MGLTYPEREDKDSLQTILDWAEINEIPDYELSQQPDCDEPYMVGLPKTTIQLQCLQELSLPRCNLIDIPNEIKYLENLTHIDLSENPLLELPDEIFNLPNLKALYFYDCDRLKLTDSQEKKLIEIHNNGCYIGRYIGLKGITPE